MRLQRLESQLDELHRQRWDAASTTCEPSVEPADDEDDADVVEVQTRVLPSAQAVAAKCRTLLHASPRCCTRLWINLTAGLEVLPAMEPDLLPALHFTRIRSTHCERSEYDALIRDLDSSLLLQLADRPTLVGPNTRHIQG